MSSCGAEVMAGPPGLSLLDGRLRSTNAPAPENFFAGANRGHYRNPRVDALLEQARVAADQSRRREMFAEVQRIVSADLPYINLWYLDNVSVHRQRIANIALSPAGDFDFLTKITLH